MKSPGGTDYIFSIETLNLFGEKTENCNTLNSKKNHSFLSRERR